jgi:hypothetical protein
MAATTNASQGESLLMFAGGFVVAVVLQRLTGWWLNSGIGIAATLGGVFVLSVIAALVRSGGRRARLTWLWAGVNVGLTIALVLSGPGTIWPIVMVVGAALTGATVMIGGLIGAFAVPAAP